MKAVAIALSLTCGCVVSGFGDDDAPPPVPSFENHVQLLAALATGKVKPVDFDAPAAEGVIAAKGLVYKTAGGRRLELDLYRPEKADAAVPLVVFIHGGAWSSGGRWHYTGYCRHLAGVGYAAATISYRLSGRAPYPAALDDCRDAIKWLRANAETYRIDPERVAVAGGSAGGHLAMLVGYTGESEVDAVVNIYGVYDLTTPAMRKSRPVREFLDGARYRDAAEQFLEASPKSHLDKGDPPTLVMHGTLDVVVPVEQSDALVERLEQLGIGHVYDRLEGWDHIMDAAAPVNARCLWQMERFFAKHLR